MNLHQRTNGARKGSPYDTIAHARQRLSGRELPRIPIDEMVDACRQLDDAQAKAAVRTRLLPLPLRDGRRRIVAGGAIGLRQARRRRIRVDAWAEPDEMLYAFQRAFGRQASAYKWRP